MAKMISIVSGKGGVGKSTFTAALGAAMATGGCSVIIIDMDFGLRAQDILLSVENSIVFDLLDTVAGYCPPDQALIKIPDYPGLSLLPAAQFARAKSLDMAKFRGVLKTIRDTSDFILIDCPAGLEKGFRNVLAARCDETVLMVTPDDLCIRDAERTLQVMEAKKTRRPCLVVNRLDAALIQSGEMPSAQSVADLLDLTLLGEIPEDPSVYRAVLNHRTYLRYDCKARDAVFRIAARIRGRDIPLPSIGLRKRKPLLKRLFRRNKSIKEVASLDSY